MHGTLALMVALGIGAHAAPIPPVPPLPGQYITNTNSPKDEKFNVSSGTTRGKATLGTAVITGADGSGNALVLDNGWLRFGFPEVGIRWQDGTISTSARGAGGGGHIISTGMGSPYTDFPARARMIFDPNFYAIVDSPTVNATIIGAWQSCQQIPQEKPGGIADGTNDEFYLAHDPKLGSDFVYVNGLQQAKGSGDDYTIDKSTITFNPGYVPHMGAEIRVSYCYPTYAPDLNWSPPMKINGSQIQDSTIDVLQLVNALKNPIQSVVDGAYKKVTRIEYNPATGDLRITYEE